MGPLRFASDLAVFAAGSSLAVLTLAMGRTRRRAGVVLAGGATAIAASAFLDGGGLFSELVAPLRIAGVVALAACLPWCDRQTRAPSALACLALAVVPETSGLAVAANVAGAAAMAAAVARSTRRSTAASVAASTASPVGVGAIAAAGLLAFATATSVFIAPPVDGSAHEAPPPPAPRARTVERAVPAAPLRPPRPAPAATVPPVRDVRTPPPVDDTPPGSSCTPAGACALVVKTVPSLGIGLDAHVPIIDDHVSLHVSITNVLARVLGAVR